MVNLNVNTVMNFGNLLGFSIKIPMLLQEYYDQWADPMEYYLNGIDVDLWRLIDKVPSHVDRLEEVGTTGEAEDMIFLQNKEKANDKRCVYELRGALPRVMYNYIRGCTTSQEIWNMLKENY